jgi:hypothetical protein
MKKIIYITLVICSSIFLSTCAKDSANNNNNTSKSGSLARFTTVDNTLYTIDGNTFKVIDISNPASPSLIKTITTNTTILETLFQYENYLLFGTPTGMVVYDISNRISPTYTTQVEHVFGCDPVVAQNGYAYVTIRSGTQCRQTVAMNLLEVVNVQNMTNSFVERQINMTNPNGLGVDGNLLFVTDGVNGIQIFDVMNPSNPTSFNSIAGTNFIDVIADNKTLYALRSNGITQYNYTDSTNIVELSSINY